MPPVSHSDITIEQGLDFMLSHFSEPIWPRNIATAATQTKQHTVENRDRALLYYKAALGQDCRLAIYPNHERMIENGCLDPSCKPIPTHLFIELDLKDFDNDKDKLDAALKSTLRRIKQQLNVAVPTVLWSGGGYHIHQPLDIDKPFDELEEFKKYENVSVKFLRYAARQLSAGKSDPNHNISFKSCLCRVPGSVNSKYQDEEVAEVKIVQSWNKVRAKPTSEFITEFLIALTQKKIDKENAKTELVHERISTKTYGNTNITTTTWIECLLGIPLADYRKNARDLILVPYLIVRRGLSPNETYNIVMEWADRCSELRSLQPSANAFVNRIRTRIQEVVRDQIPPMTFSKLKEMNPALHETLFTITKDINRSQYNCDYMQSINTDENLNNKKLLSEKALENLRKNKEQKARDSKYISWEDGEEKELYFDAEKIRTVPSKFDESKNRYEYTVVDLRNFPDMEKIWTVSKTTSDMIDEKLAEGYSILLISCEGEGTSRKFKIVSQRS